MYPLKRTIGIGEHVLRPSDVYTIYLSMFEVGMPEVFVYQSEWGSYQTHSLGTLGK